MNYRNLSRQYFSSSDKNSSLPARSTDFSSIRFLWNDTDLSSGTKCMNPWPKSLPDYKWPQHLLSRRMAPVRVTLAVLFHFAHALGRILSLLSLLERRPKPILVIRTDGIGDAFLFEPAMENLARFFSPYPIHLWAPWPVCRLFENCPAVRRSMTVPRGFKAGNLAYFHSPWWRIKLGFALGRWRFDTAVYPAESPEPLGNWLFCSVRAEHRWLNHGDTANQFDWQQQRAHQRATRILQNSPDHVHELLRNEHLARQWSDQTTLRKPKLHFSEQQRSRAQKQMQEWRRIARSKQGQAIVGVVPAASMTVKCYPDAKWGETLSWLWKRHRAMPALLGGPDDAQAMDRLAHALQQSSLPCLRLSRPLDIVSMAALVGRLDSVLSVDTALAHFAVAQEVPTVVLVGGGQPGRFFPWPNARHHIALSVPTPCSGCNNRCSQPEPICLTGITPEQIVAAWCKVTGLPQTIEVQIARKHRLQAAG